MEKKKTPKSPNLEYSKKRYKRLIHEKNMLIYENFMLRKRMDGYSQFARNLLINRDQHVREGMSERELLRKINELNAISGMPDSPVIVV